MSTPHPLKKWLERKAMSLEALSEVLQRKYDLKASPVYLETIAEGYYAPGKKLSLAISKETKISIEKLILFPYRAPRHSEAAS